MGGRYSQEKKLEAAKLIVATMTTTKPKGNQLIVSKKLGITENTISTWRQTKWFQKMISDIKMEILTGMEPDLLGGLIEAQAGLVRRIKSEYQDIPIERVPGCLKDLNHVSQLLQGKPTDIREELANESTEDLLEMLKRATDRLDDASNFGESAHRPDADDDRIGVN